MKKIQVWDILTGVTLLAMVCLACAFTQIFANPTSGFNPFPPPTPIQPVVIEPTFTVTAVVRIMPPTWTPTATIEASATQGMVLKPSSTIEPTNTLFIAPTITPLPTETRTPLPTRADARCQIVSESPLDNAQFSPNQEFDKRWTLRNTSGQTWRADSVDIRFQSGTGMHVGNAAYDLSRDVPNNDSFDFVVRLRAPSSVGTYTANWALVNGSNDLCKFYVKIEVK